MDVREKMAELIRCADYHPCRGAVRKIGSMFTTEFIEDIASQLIDNGVTVQEQDGCEYCNGLTFSQMEDFTMPNASKKDYDIVTIRYCPMCGRKLPQPPKGE